MSVTSKTNMIKKLFGRVWWFRDRAIGSECNRRIYWIV